MNEYINNEKKIKCEVTTLYIKWDVLDVLKKIAQIAKPNFGKCPAANFFYLNSNRNIFYISFVGNFRAGNIINVRTFFFSFLTHQLLTMVNKRHKNRFLLLKSSSKKLFLLYFCFGYKTISLNTPRNF